MYDKIHYSKRKKNKWNRGLQKRKKEEEPWVHILEQRHVKEAEWLHQWLAAPPRGCVPSRLLSAPPPVIVSWTPRLRVRCRLSICLHGCFCLFWPILLTYLLGPIIELGTPSLTFVSQLVKWNLICFLSLITLCWLCQVSGWTVA